MEINKYDNSKNQEQKANIVLFCKGFSLYFVIQRICANNEFEKKSKPKQIFENFLIKESTSYYAQLVRMSYYTVS